MNQRKAIISSYIGVIAMASVVFIAGGKLVYPQALLYLVLAILGTALTHILTPKGSNIAARRVDNAKTGEAWDRKLVGIFFLLNIVTYVIAGLDSGRFGWSGAMPLAVTVAGAVVMFTGQVIYALARRENAFFSSTVQIENSHSVCSTGLYGIVCHPGYLGMALSLLSFPFVLGSFWAAIPVSICLVLLIVRIELETRFLLENLTGYREYYRSVKYKLIPFIY